MTTNFKRLQLARSDLGILHQLLSKEPASASTLVQVYAERCETRRKFGKERSWTLRELQDLTAKFLAETSSNVKF